MAGGRQWRGGMSKVAGVRLGCWGSNSVVRACMWWWVWRCRGRSALVSGLKREVTINMCWGGRVAKRRGGEGARLLLWPPSETAPLAPAEAQGWALLCGSEKEVVAATVAGDDDGNTMIVAMPAATRAGVRRHNVSSGGNFIKPVPPFAAGATVTGTTMLTSPPMGGEDGGQHKHTPPLFPLLSPLIFSLPFFSFSLSPPFSPLFFIIQSASMRKKPKEQSAKRVIWRTKTSQRIDVE